MIKIAFINRYLEPILAECGEIPIDDDFFQLRKIAADRGLTLIATIDDEGYTVINDLQMDQFREEIEQLQRNDQINQKIVKKLKKISNMPQSHDYYILFTGIKKDVHD